MSIHYVSQRVADLYFGISESRLEPTQFQILKSLAITQEHYQAELWIIGSSHALNLSTPYGSFSEVLTCSPSTAISDELLWYKRGAQDCAWEHHAGDGLSYKTSMMVVEMSASEFLRQHNCICTESLPQRLFYRFPQPDSLPLPPVTLIDVIQNSVDCFEIRTLHTYVEEFSMVWTHSLVQMRV